MRETVGSEVTRYLLDGDQIIRELNAGGETTATLVHGLGLGADIGSLVKAERSGQGQYFHYDWRGSVIALTDPTEQAIQTYNYDAFGNVRDSSGSTVNPYQFSSKQFDSNSGLSYFGRRHYSASLGRFTTQDPKEYVDGLNTYAYVKNNQVNWIDRLGLSTKCIEFLDIGVGVYGRYLDGIKTGDCELKPVEKEYWKWRLKEVQYEGEAEPGVCGGPGIAWTAFSCVCIKCHHVVMEGVDDTLECNGEEVIGGGDTMCGSGYAYERCTNKCNDLN